MYLIYQKAELPNKAKLSDDAEAVVPVAIVDSEKKAKNYCDFLKMHHGENFHRMFIPFIDFDR